MEGVFRKLIGSRISAPDPFVRYLTRNVEDLRNFNLKEGDIFVITYPKCGSHWMMYLIWGILHKGEKPPDFNEFSRGLFPFIELSGTQIADTMKSPRTFKSHLPANLVPYSSKAKYIHVTRNPFDCCLSYDNYCKSYLPEFYEDLTLDQNFDDFMNGDTPYGDYFQHALDWYKHKDDENYLHITYEDMSKDHRGCILKVSKFLGEDHYRDIANDEELLKKIEYHSSFSFMQSLPKLSILKFTEDMNFRNNAQISDSKLRTVELMNKGLVGRYKKAFSEEQQQKMRNKMEDKFRNTGLLYDGE